MLKQGDAVVSFEATVSDPEAHTQTRTLERIVAARPTTLEVEPLGLELTTDAAGIATACRMASVPRASLALGFGV